MEEWAYPCSLEMYDYRTLITRKEIMYLQVTDIIAIVIALGVSVTLVITSAIQNARLQRAVGEYRKAWLIARESSYIVCDDHKVSN